LVSRTTSILTPILTVIVLWTWLCRDSTIYAPGYSWSKFSSIRNGMTPREVTRILGQPLSIEPFDGEILWDHGLQDQPVATVGGPISPPASVEAGFVADWSGKIIYEAIPDE
jgi:hypothetical protein